MGTDMQACVKHKQFCHFQYSAARTETLTEGGSGSAPHPMAACNLRESHSSHSRSPDQQGAHFPENLLWILFSSSCLLAVCPAAHKMKPAGGGSGLPPHFTPISPRSSPQHQSPFLS